LGSFAEKVFTSIQLLITPLSASSYLDIIIAHKKLQAADFNVLVFIGVIFIDRAVVLAIEVTLRKVIRADTKVKLMQLI
jgi:hypothetical protein